MQKLTLLKIVFTITIYSILNSCKDDSPVVPEIKIKEASIERTTVNSIMQFSINLNVPTTVDVSFDYLLVDGTALSTKDYIGASGTLSIPAGETQAALAVQIVGDPTNLRRENLSFTVQLSNPKLCTFGNASAQGIIISENGSYLPTDNKGYTTPLTYPGYNLVWSDEFSDANLNTAIWNQEIGNNNGWGNHELEFYTNSTKNTFLSNGNLIIEARKETIEQYSYTSGRMTTQGKKTFKYGRIDIRAKLPVGKGIWPALWMLGSNINSVGWAACGEIDIMELVGTFPSRITSTMHWSNNAKVHASMGANYNLTSGDFSQEFHVFSIVWKQNLILSYMDDILFFTISDANIAPSNNPFNSDQFFIFNVAVGGDWPGSPDGTTIFPQRMFVDYVRVFQ